jgi:hypothetical protein
VSDRLLTFLRAPCQDETKAQATFFNNARFVEEYNAAHANHKARLSVASTP